MLDRSNDLIYIEKLKLAAWLILNGHKLIERRLESDGAIMYVFGHSPEIPQLIDRWTEKTPHEVSIARFSSIVSFEIRKAVQMRRNAGMATRLRSLDKQ